MSGWHTLALPRTEFQCYLRCISLSFLQFMSEKRAITVALRLASAWQLFSGDSGGASSGTRSLFRNFGSAMRQQNIHRHRKRAQQGKSGGVLRLFCLRHMHTLGDGSCVQNGESVA